MNKNCKLKLMIGFPGLKTKKYKIQSSYQETYSRCLFKPPGKEY